MKLIHMADSHLGFSAYSKVDTKGRNLREQLVYRGFERAVDEIIKHKPDVLVHAGDVFHSVSPKIESLYVFKQALERFVDEGIQVVIISGNHDAPKSLVASSPFKLYDGMKGVYIAHKYEYQPFELDDYTFHCIPFCYDPKMYASEFSKINKNLSGNDVLVMHGLYEALKHKRLRTVGEHEIGNNILKWGIRNFIYVALGHYHGQIDLANNSWYSGSIEYFRFSESQDKKGMLLIDLDQQPIKPKNIPVDVVNMLDLELDNLRDKAAEDVLSDVYQLCDDANITNKIVRITLNDILRETFKNINLIKISELRQRAVYLEIIPKIYDDKQAQKSEQINIKRLSDEFKVFLDLEISRNNIPLDIRNDVVNYGTKLIKQVS